MDAGWGRGRAVPFVVAVIGALLFSVASFASHSPRASALGNCTADGSLDSEEQAFLGLINAYRAQNGLAALSTSTNLNRAAAWLVVDLGANNYFSHTDSLGRSPSQRVMDCGYPQGAGENIAAGTVASTAQQAFDMWKASAGHNANMLNGSYRQIGIGRAYNGASTYGWYWATDFGTTNDGTGGGVTQPSNTPTPVPTTPPPTATPTRTPTLAPTQPTSSPTTSPTQQPTATPTNTPRPANSATAAPSATATPTSSSTATVTAAPTQSPTATPTTAATSSPTVAPSPAGTLPLSPGANLVSWPSGDVPPAQALGNTANTISVIYAWDPVNRTWQRYGPGLPSFLNNLPLLHQGQAYWVIAKTSGQLPMAK